MAELSVESLKKVIAMLESKYTSGQERAALAGAQQSAVSSGLSGTTRPMAVSAGMQAGFEDVRQTKLADALTRLGALHAGKESEDKQLRFQERFETKRLALARDQLKSQEQASMRQFRLGAAQINPDWGGYAAIAPELGGSAGRGLMNSRRGLSLGRRY